MIPENGPKTPATLNAETAAALLNLGKLPAILTQEQVATLLSRKPHWTPDIIRGGFLAPLGKPAANGPKLFAAKDVLTLCNDRNRLDELVEYIRQRTKSKNDRARIRKMEKAMQLTRA